MTRLKRDPFLDALEKHADLESALAELEGLLNRNENRTGACTTSAKHDLSRQARDL
jgi:hypothetical protein